MSQLFTTIGHYLSSSEVTSGVVAANNAVNAFSSEKNGKGPS